MKLARKAAAAVHAEVQRVGQPYALGERLLLWHFFMEVVRKDAYGACTGLRGSFLFGVAITRSARSKFTQAWCCGVEYLSPLAQSAGLIGAGSGMSAQPRAQ